MDTDSIFFNLSRRTFLLASASVVVVRKLFQNLFCWPSESSCAVGPSCCPAPQEKNRAESTLELIRADDFFDRASREWIFVLARQAIIDDARVSDQTRRCYLASLLSTLCSSHEKSLTLTVCISLVNCCPVLSQVKEAQLQLRNSCP